MDVSVLLIIAKLVENLGQSYTPCQRNPCVGIHNRSWENLWVTKKKGGKVLVYTANSSWTEDVRFLGTAWRNRRPPKPKQEWRRTPLRRPHQSPKDTTIFQSFSSAGETNREVYFGWRELSKRRVACVLDLLTVYCFLSCTTKTKYSLPVMLRYCIVYYRKKKSLLSVRHRNTDRKGVDSC